MEQISRDKFPSNGGWKFRQPQFGPGWVNSMAMVGFDASVRNIISERKKNAALRIRHSLSTDYETVARELIAYNRSIRNIPDDSLFDRTFTRAQFKNPLTVSSQRMTGRICITTTFDRNYALAGKTLMKSIRHYTDCSGVDFKVITADPEVVKMFGSENCHFVDEATKDRYKNVAYSPALPRERYCHSWYRYELFNFPGYERVICIDSDCLCVNDLSYLFSEALNDFDIISVEDHIVSKCFTRDMAGLEGQGLNLKPLKQRLAAGKVDIQPALIVANARVVNEAWYLSLLRYANTTPFTYSIDEGILNDFIYQDGLRIRLLPLEYDYQDLYEVHIPRLPVPAHPVIVHCEESKPFKKAKKSLDPRLYKWHDLWWNEHNA